MQRDDKFSRPRRPFSGRPGGHERRGKPGQSLSEEIMELDSELLGLLVRRSILMSKLRKGRAHASNPGIVKSEKAIRNAWEQQAGRLSNSPRLSRQLFSLINELEIQTQKGEIEQSAFNLNPPRQALDIDIPGPPSSASAQLWLGLAASGGLPLRLAGVTRSAALLGLARAFEQCGVELAWEDGDLILTGKKAPDYHGKAIFVGDDLLSLYTFVFLALAKPGKLRLTGGATLKEAELGSLGHLLPKLGARLVSVVPGTKGLPVNVECSGELPSKIDVPAELPYPAVLGLLLAAITWEHKVSLNLAALPKAAQVEYLALAGAFADVLPGVVLLLEDGVEFNGDAVADLNLPAQINIKLDPVLSGTYLAMPIFAGGKVRLTGELPENQYANELRLLLSPFGLKITGSAHASVSGEIAEGSSWPQALELAELSEVFHPLFWVLNARLAQRAKGPIELAVYPKGANLELAEDLLAQAGFKLSRPENVLQISPMEPEEFKEAASRTYGWPCPSCEWGLALSLAAFMRSNLKISNPDCVSRVLPEYWYYYNRLPAPRAYVADEAADVEARPASRRRIKTESIANTEPLEGFEDGD